MKQQHKEYNQSLGTSTNHIGPTERKKKLQLPEYGNKVNSFSRNIFLNNYFS